MMPSLGTLHLVPANDHPDLMAAPTMAMIITLSHADTLSVAEIDPNLSDTAAFCDAYHVGLNQSANCVILEAKRGERKWLAACLILGNTRADINGLGRRTLDARRVSFAPIDKAVAETHMEYGGITPIGLPPDWPILIDKAVADAEWVIIGSGIRKSKLVVPGHVLASLPNAQMIEGLAQ